MSWSAEIQDIQARKDSRLRTLELALDPGHMRDVLGQCHARYAGGGRIDTVDIAVFRRHVNRCVVRYRLAGVDSAGRPHARGVIGKVQDAGVGEAVRAAMIELWNHGFDRDAADGITMPEPYEYLPSLALLLQEEVGGTPGRVLIREAPGPGPMRVAARALAKLHMSGVPVRAPRGVREHLKRCHPRHEFLPLALPELREAIESIVDRALAVEQQLGDVDITLVHGDFHLGQLHVEGERVWLVDFDAMGWADPASDLGNLLAFLKDKAKRDPAIDALIAAFLDEYAAHARPGIVERAPLYEAITYLRRACKAMRIQDEGWREKAARMVRSGVEAIERMERSLANGVARPSCDGGANGHARATANEAGSTHATGAASGAGLEAVRPGQRVKVRGAASDSRFRAVEVELRPEDRSTLVESVVERIDPARRELVLMGERLQVSAAAEVTGLEGEPIGFESIAPRARVRIAGRWTPETGFVAETLRVLEPREFEIEKIQGPVDRVDPAARVIRVLGFPVTVDPRTKIEARK